MNIDSWHRLEDEVRERHRADLFQVLAYASMADVKRISCCLVYPCRPETYVSLAKRNRIAHKASIAMNDRLIDVRLTALPLNMTLTDAAASLRQVLMN